MYLKHIPMDGPQNFRDLGGFLTASGQVVAWNRLYRADGLSGLSEGDIAWFRRLNIRTIMDLRSTAEQAARPDRVPEGVRFCSCPMMREQGSGEQPGSASAFLQSLKVGYLAMIRDGAPLVGSAVN
ncbi:MAG: tyrosine-protein phosphatase, partial [bacterium]|nr:tyrosine-protein phosphatase [bacterium]